MRLIKRLSVLASTLVAISLMLSGCATMGDQRVDVLYQRSSNATGGTGDLLFVEEAAPPEAQGIQWIIGQISNKDGERLGNVVTDTAPNDLLAAALMQELKGAGYNTIQVRSLPPETAKGVVLKNAFVNLDEVKSAATLETKCKVKIAVEPWVNGRALSRVSYEAEYSETAVTGRDELPGKTLLHAIRTVMMQSAPEIVKTLERK